jgi:hypothetical protein
MTLARMVGGSENCVEPQRIASPGAIDRLIQVNTRNKKSLTIFMLSGTIVRYRTFYIPGRRVGTSKYINSLPKVL